MQATKMSPQQIGAARRKLCASVLQRLRYTADAKAVEELLSQSQFLGALYDLLYGESGWSKFLTDLNRRLKSLS